MVLYIYLLGIRTMGEKGVLEIAYASLLPWVDSSVFGFRGSEIYRTVKWREIIYDGFGRHEACLFSPLTFGWRGRGGTLMECMALAVGGGHLFYTQQLTIVEVALPP